MAIRREGEVRVITSRSIYQPQYTWLFLTVCRTSDLKEHPSLTQELKTYALASAKFEVL